MMASQGPGEPRGRADEPGPIVSSTAGLSGVEAEGSPAPPPVDTLPSWLADHPDYEITRELGRGGMGVVYLARNRLMGRMEVLKVVGSHLTGRGEVVERFLAEIRHAALLQHPNIVTAYTALRFGESLVLVMEFVEGLDLSRLVSTRGPLPIAHACKFAHQAALGLQHAHEQGMVHRDIKPSNLMLTRQGDRALVKVLDFGLAKVRSEGGVDHGLTHEGQMLGTPAYIAPEQIRNAREADIRADIYSLGCTLYYLLSGGPPFQGDCLYDVLQAHHSMEAMPLNLRRPEVPVELAAVVAKMMAKEPGRRFQQPRDVARALAPFSRKGEAALKSPEVDVSRAGRSDPGRGMPDVASTPDRPVADDAGPMARPRGVSGPPASAPDRETLIDRHETGRTPDGAASTAPVRQPRWVWPSVVNGVLMLGLLAAWWAGLFRARTPDGETARAKPIPEAARVEAVAATDGPPAAARGPARPPMDAPPQEPAAPPQEPANPPPAAADAPSPAVARARAKGGFRPLFNGRDLTGWRRDPKRPGNWRVAGGVLIGSGPAAPSHLETERGDFTDFHLRVEARFNEVGSGAIFVRCPSSPTDDPGSPGGLEVTINNARVVRHSTGEIYTGRGGEVVVADFFTSHRVPFGQWFSLDVIVDGTALAVKLNGKTSAYLVGSPRFRPSGHIVLQQYSPESLIEFRRIEIKELDHLDGDSREIACIRGARDRVSRVAFSPDGLKIFSGENANVCSRVPNNNFIRSGHDYALRLWEVAGGRNLFTMGGQGGAATAIAVSSDGRHAASTDAPRGNPILVWDLETGARLRRFVSQNKGADCHALSFSPDDRRVMAALGDGTVLVWDVASGEEQTPIRLESVTIRQRELSGIAFTADRRHLVARRRTGPIEVWELPNNRKVHTFADRVEGLRALACSADGRLILSVESDGLLRLRDSAGGKAPGPFRIGETQVRCLALSPDGRRALVAGEDGPVHLWDLGAGKELCRLEGHIMRVNSLAFSPDGRRALSGGDDRTLRLWRLPD